MSATLTQSQLKAALTNEQIQEAKTKGLGDGETLDPVAEEIDTACAKVDTYAAGYQVGAGMLTGWARDLAAHQVAKRLGSPTTDQVRAFDRANKELEDLRDGKFKHIPRTPVAGTSTTSGQVKSGGKPKID